MKGGEERFRNLRRGEKENKRVNDLWRKKKTSKQTNKTHKNRHKAREYAREGEFF